MRDAVAMGTRLHVELGAPDRAVAMAAAESALTTVARWEGLLSTWDADAELAQANRTPVGRCIPISAALFGALAEAGRWVAATGGAFDPAIGALVDAWDLRGRGRVPTAGELETARATSGWSAIELRPGPPSCLMRRHAGAWLDTGGFGKGLALRDALAAARAAGATSTMFDFGGQVAVAGSPRDVAVAHPTNRGRPVASISAVTGSVSSSGQSERFVVAGLDTLGHLLDPRTGRPAPAWGSVTVVARDPLAADALSTALFVMGPDAALAWASRHPEIGVLTLERRAGSTVRARWSPSLAGRITLLDPSTTQGDT